MGTLYRIFAIYRKWRYIPAVVNSLRAAEDKPALSLDMMCREGLVVYVPFPDALRGKYQSFTQADISALRKLGYKKAFLTVEEGVGRYVERLLARRGGAKRAT